MIFAEKLRFAVRPSNWSVIVPRIVLPFAVIGIGNVQIAFPADTLWTRAGTGLNATVALHVTVPLLIVAPVSLRAATRLTVSEPPALGLSGARPNVFTTSASGAVFTS